LDGEGKREAQQSNAQGTENKGAITSLRKGQEKKKRGNLTRETTVSFSPTGENTPPCEKANSSNGRRARKGGRWIKEGKKET